MTWIKIDDADGGVYAKEATPDPEEIVTLGEIEREIADLKARLTELQSQWLALPEGVSVEVQRAIEAWNRSSHPTYAEELAIAALEAKRAALLEVG